jgi:hypothetical protein
MKSHDSQNIAWIYLIFTHNSSSEQSYNLKIEKPNDQYLGLICDKSLTRQDLNSNPGYFSDFILIFIRVENHVYLSHGIQMTGATRIMVGVGDLV